MSDKPGFLTDLVVKKRGSRWQLTEDLVFYSANYRGTFTVKQGFVTDFASIPRGLWNLFPKNGRYDPVAVLHDAGYENALLAETGEKQFTTKQVADRLFAEGLKAVGVNAVSRFFMVRMVTLFGDHQGHPSRQQGKSR